MHHVQNTSRVRHESTLQSWGIIINSLFSNRDMFGRQVTSTAAGTCDNKLFKTAILKNLKINRQRIQSMLGDFSKTYRATLYDIYLYFQQQ